MHVAPKFLNLLSGKSDLKSFEKNLAKLSAGILTLDPLYCACPHIRLYSTLGDLIAKDMVELQPICESVENQVKINYSLARTLDLLIVQRQFPAIVPYALLMRRLGGATPKIVFEIDDALTMLPETHIGYGGSRFVSPLIQEYIRKADLVTVSTAKLKSYYGDLNPNIVVLENCIDLKLWGDLPEPAGSSGPVKILFSGTVTHEADLRVIEGVIEKIILEFGDTVKFLFWGNTSAKLKHYPQVEELHVFLPDYAEYADRLKNTAVDFAIIPLEDNPFNQAKSAIKWLEYSVCKIPGIYSDVGAYRTVVQNGETGILVNNTSASWYNAIKKLVVEPSYRQRIGSNAQAEVLRNNTVGRNSINWIKSYREMFSAVSIIIPVFNRCEHTRKCIAALKKFPPPGAYEVIVIDNGSTDGTGDFLKSLGDPLVKVIANQVNHGFAKACNQGAEAARYPYLLFLNNDTEPTRNWLNPLLRVLEKDLSVAGVGSKLLYPDNTIQHAGVVIADDRSIGDPLIARHAYYKMPTNLPEANQLKTYQALTAACFLTRKQAFDSVEGFDEGYWNGYEDIDLCFKLEEKNWKLVYQPESVVIHHESQSGRERFSRARENIRRLHKKWIGKIKPDMTIQKDGSATIARPGRILPYAEPVESSSVLKRLPGGGYSNRVSIIILTLNELKFTKQCVGSIQRCTPEPHEIIFVDNGSTDGTIRWLRKLLQSHSNYQLIENKKNLGFAKGCNQGILLSTSENILLLNNDVVVTPNWLEGMLECLKSTSDVGIVGPMTNNISGIQKVPQVGYSHIDGLEDYARKFRERYRYRWIPSRRIVGFCMLFKRKLAEEIGFLDENFDSGNFEDDDYCLRAHLSGYQNMIAADVFVHHFGSRSFIANKLDYRHLLSGNRKLFRNKWNRTDVAKEYSDKLIVENAISKAEELYRLGRMEQAIGVLARSITKAPTERRIYYLFAEMLIDTKRYADALEILEAMRIEDKDERRMTLIGQCQQGLGNGQAAEHIADQALAIEPSSVSAMNLKGICAFQKGEPDAAEQWFEKAMQAKPSFGESFTNLGVLRWEIGKRREALEWFERGFILSATAVDVMTAYHSAACDLNEFSKAEGSFREARALYPYDQRLSFFMIDLLIRQGKLDSAMFEIENAMMRFGIGERLLSSARCIREKIGPQQTGSSDAGAKTVSLCMIVKNEEQTMGKCLMSAKPVVNEIIVVDTGSTDRTREIAFALGAKVFDFPWSNDFAQARNFSLSKASGDWVLVLDADEVVSASDHLAIKNFFHKLVDKRFAYSMVTRNYTDQIGTRGWTPNDGKYSIEEAGRGWVPSAKVRLFPNDRRIYFENAVHELVEPSLAKLERKILPCDIPVHHYGRLNRDKVLAKGEAYYRMGMKKVEGATDAYLALKELAIQAGELGKFTEAVALWERIIGLNSKDATAWMNAGYALLMLNRYAEAAEFSKKAMELDPGLREAVLNYAGCELVEGDAQKAIALLAQLLQKEPDYAPAMGRIAAAYLLGGQRDEGFKCLEWLWERGYDPAGILKEQSQALLTRGSNAKADLLREAADQLSALDQNRAARGAGFHTAPGNRSAAPGCFCA
jgi:GT2 family glycosyltransferase/Tfp pilus assembly protein PilF/glycosyltransferase involved in cell wall biosynthesis